MFRPFLPRFGLCYVFLYFHFLLLFSQVTSVCRVGFLAESRCPWEAFVYSVVGAFSALTLMVPEELIARV